MMGTRQTKVPPPYTAQTADPGAKPADTSGASGAVTQAQVVADGRAFQAWIQADMQRKASTPLKDYTTGSESGTNSN